MTILQYILLQTGVSSLNELKNKLYKKRKFEYGGYTSSIECKGFTAIYTSNCNSFATYIFSFKGIGMSHQLGFDAASITQAGKERGCNEFYCKPAFLNAEYGKE